MGTRNSPAVETLEDPQAVVDDQQQAAVDDQHVVLRGAISVEEEPQMPWKPSRLAQTLSYQGMGL